MQTSLKILFMTVSMLALVSCSAKKSGNQKFRFTVSAIQTGLPINGGSFVRAINATSTSIIKLDATDSAEFEHGTWEFQTVSFEGPTTFGGKRYCGRAQNVVLSEAARDLSLNISEANCLSEPFISLISSINSKFNTNAALGIATVTPSSGSIAGGNTVTIYGSGFLTGVTVTIGGNACTTVTLIDPTSLTCMTSAHGAGQTDVVVTNPGATPVTGANLFTYNGAPYLSSISPIGGAISGGTVVTITGTGFITGATAYIGGVPCASTTVTSPILATCTTPAGTPGIYNIGVTNPDGQVSPTAQFTYSAPPTISGVTPANGPLAGGTTITINGTNLTNTTSVKLAGSITCNSLTNVSPTSVTCITPSHSAASVSVTVVKGDGQETTLASAFNYANAPIVSSVDFNYGDIAGGTLVTINGSNFANGAAVYFDNIGCNSITFINSSSITCVTPSHAAGSVSVKVMNPDSQYSTLASAFNYRQSFISVWRTTTPGESITLPLKSIANYNFEVSWGDGSSSRITSFNDPDITHVYSATGDYTVKMSGVAEAWGGFSQVSKLNLISVVNLGDMSWIDLSQAFYDNSNLVSFAGGVTTSVTNMDSMFYSTTSITTLDVSSFNTSNVTNMHAMFGHINILQNLNLVNFNTVNVTNMSFMFEQNSLPTLNLSSFNTSNVTTMAFMFNGSSSLATLDLSSFETTNVTDMTNMFQSSGALTSINVSSFVTTNVTSMAMMFAYTGVTTLDLSHFNTSNVSNMNEMFKNTTNLTSLNTTGWDITLASSSIDVFTGKNTTPGLVVTCDIGGSPGVGMLFTENCAP